MGTLSEGWRGREDAGRGAEKNVELNKNWLKKQMGMKVDKKMEATGGEEEGKVVNL